MARVKGRRLWAQRLCAAHLVAIKEIQRDGEGIQGGSGTISKEDRGMLLCGGLVKISQGGSAQVKVLKIAAAFRPVVRSKRRLIGFTPSDANGGSLITAMVAQELIPHFSRTCISEGAPSYSELLQQPSIAERDGVCSRKFVVDGTK